MKSRSNNSISSNNSHHSTHSISSSSRNSNNGSNNNNGNNRKSNVNNNSTNTTPIELLKQLVVRFSTLDTAYFLSLMMLNIIISMYLIKDNDFSNSILLKSFDNEIVSSMGTLGTCCIIMVTIRSILESIDSDEINKYFKDSSVKLDDAVIFNLILSFAISSPLLSMSLSYCKVAFYILFDASVSFNITCGLSMICCIKASQRNRSRYFYHIICASLLVSRLLFIKSINSSNTFPISVSNSLQVCSMSLLFFAEFAYDVKDTIKKFQSGQFFVFNSLENIKLAFTFFHIFQYLLYGVLKIYYEYFNSKEFSYLNYKPYVIILFQTPTLLINLAILIIPKRLDSDIKKSLEELIRQSMNQKEELAVVGDELTIMIKKNEILLEKIFPARIVRCLRDNKPVKPESFDDATIFFSDIEGFTKICLHADPMDVFLLLNKLYTLMDMVAKNFNVYKIETIGDAYVVGCGIGEVEDSHDKSVDFCVRVADFALVVSSVVGLVEYQLPSMNLTSPIRIRVGLNSGPVIGGVVGTSMPRYCLFGSTINIASRMESTGVPGRIQVSENTARILQGTGYYNLEERGEIEVKNGGIIKTFWLLSASHKHPKISDDYMNAIRSKAERLLHHKFSALRAKKSMLGLMFESDKSDDTIELHHSMLTSVKKMPGSFRVTSNLSESDRGSVSSNFSVRTLAIVGSITIRGDEHAWDISYMNDLDCCLNEIEYGNTYSAILIDLDCSDSIRTDFALFKKKLEDMHYNNSLIIGLTNNYLEANAMKIELGVSILVKPLDFKIFNKIFSTYQLHYNLLHD